jgi:hypothetical protein
MLNLNWLFSFKVFLDTLLSRSKRYERMIRQYSWLYKFGFSISLLYCNGNLILFSNRISLKIYAKTTYRFPFGSSHIHKPWLMTRLNVCAMQGKRGPNSSNAVAAFISLALSVVMPACTQSFNPNRFNSYAIYSFKFLLIFRFVSRRNDKSKDTGFISSLNTWAVRHM